MIYNYLDDIISIWNWLMRNIFYINIILAIFIVFFERRNPNSVWAWLLVLYFIPIIGFILYLFLGQDYHKRKMFKTKEIEDVLNSEIRRQEDNIVNKKFGISDSLLQDYSDLVLYNLEASRSIYSEDNSITIYTDGNDKYDALIKEIEKAKKFIHIQYYIIRDDALLARMEEALYKKIQEGVEVRILYDAMGGRGIRRKTLKRLRAEGFKIGVFFPAILKNFQVRINFRNHRKIVVIDGEVGFIGGYNMGIEYLGQSKKFGHWRDTHLKIVGSAVNDLQIRFILDWNYATKENLVMDNKYYNYDIRSGDVGVQIISSGPDSARKVIRDNYLRLINKAKKNIYIQTPYFVPDEAILDSLRTLATSGVDVRVMIPCMPDHPFVYWVTFSYIGELLKAGIRCFIYEDGFLHVKGMTVDGMVSSYGTANMDNRSFALNFEVNAVIYDSGTTKKLEEIFHEDLKSCREITLYDYDKRKLIIRIKEQISRLLAPLM